MRFWIMGSNLRESRTYVLKMVRLGEFQAAVTRSGKTLPSNLMAERDFD